MILMRTQTRTGLVNAFSTGHLSKLSLRSITSADILSSRAHSLVVISRPLNSSMRLVRRLLFCSVRVAHRQFFGEYGPLLSGYRSSEWSGDGFGPMSDKKFSNDSHLKSKDMPRPPYFSKSELFGFEHLFFMPLHALCSGVRLRLWRVCRNFTAALSEHLHLSDRFVRRLPVVQTRVFPHTHWHSQTDNDRCSSVRPKTVSDPNVTPVRSNVFMLTLYRNVAVQAT